MDLHNFRPEIPAIHLPCKISYTQKIDDFGYSQYAQPKISTYILFIANNPAATSIKCLILNPFSDPSFSSIQ